MRLVEHPFKRGTGPDPDVVMTFLEFAEERHRIWEQRQRGVPPPWTSDPVLAHYKFTNVFRILDPGSQFVLTDLADPELDDRDQLARLMLYRLTNLPASWTALKEWGAAYPVVETMGDDLFNFWEAYRAAGNTMFSGAYMITPDGNIVGTNKIRTVIDRAREMFREGSPHDVMPRWNAATTQRERFDALRSAPVIGDFMAMQVLTDWGYCPQAAVDREDEFVILGPGARKGAMELLNGRTGKLDEIHRWLVGAVHASPDCPVLWTGYGEYAARRHGAIGRLPSWMDVQNLLCEFSKYARYARKGSLKPVSTLPYELAHPGPQPAPVLPEHWFTY